MLKKHCGEQYFFDNQRLNEIYTSSLITLNNHNEDIAREGFINPRIFDIINHPDESLKLT